MKKPLKVAVVCALLLLGLSILGQSLPSANATITRVHGPDNNTCASASHACTSITITQANTPTEGNTLILVATASPAGAATASVTQTGVTWTLDKTMVVGMPYVYVWIYHGYVGTSPSTSILISVTSSSYGIIGNVNEYSGVLLVDKSATAYGMTAAATTGTTPTTTVSAELWVGGIGATGGSNKAQSSPTNGFTLLDGADVDATVVHTSSGFLEKIVSSTAAAYAGDTVASWTDGLWCGAIVTYYASTTTDFTITASGSISVVVGESDSITISISNLLNNPVVNLTCSSGLPLGASCSFSPSTGYATYSSTLTVYTTVATPIGSFAVVVSGVSSQFTHTTTFALIVGPSQDFSMTNSGSITVVVGSYNTGTITVTNVLGAPDVSLSCTSGLPVGASCSFSPSHGTATFASTLTVQTLSLTPLGSSGLIVTGTITGVISHSTTLTLNVVVASVTVTTTVPTTVVSTSTVVSSFSTTVMTTVSTVVTTGTAVTTATAFTYVYADIPLVLYGLAGLLAMAPAFLLLVRERTIAALLTGLNVGILWAVAAGLLNIYVLLLEVGIAALALFFRSRSQ